MSTKKEPELMEKLIALCKRRGFIFAGSEIYGGLANSWDYGPLGAQLKKNIKDEWWRRFVERRSDMVGIDAALIMNPKVWEASGHLATFTDPLVECKKCHTRFRADQPGKNFRIDVADFISGKSATWSVQGNCDVCGALAVDSFTTPKNFNLMLATHLGPVTAIDEISSNLEYAVGLGEESSFRAHMLEKLKEYASTAVYLRPETAQAMFVNFKNVLDTSRKRLPFGIAQIGKAFRNEITPGNFIFRTREFEQMEIEYFVRPEEWEQQFEYWLTQMKQWVKDLGIAESKVQYVEIPEADRAHYSKRTVDVEYQYPFGQKELYGLAYRGSFDLDNHAKASRVDLQYVDPQTNEKIVPHVIEPTWGVDRSVLVTLLEAYTEDSANERTYLKLPYWTAPYKVAVFPLLANKPALVEKARAVYDQLAKNFTVAWDDRGNVGKRYYAQDEIGTPFCITVDFETLGEEGSDKAKIDTVTVRNRDTMAQERVAIADLPSYLSQKLSQ
jgi:glycyl-tRNA synthetase